MTYDTRSEALAAAEQCERQLSTSGWTVEALDLRGHPSLRELWGWRLTQAPFALFADHRSLYHCTIHGVMRSPEAHSSPDEAVQDALQAMFQSVANLAMSLKPKNA